MREKHDVQKSGLFQATLSTPTGKMASNEIAPNWQKRPWARPRSYASTRSFPPERFPAAIGRFLGGMPAALTHGHHCWFPPDIMFLCRPQSCLAEGNLLIANVQGLRGMRSRAAVQAALSARGKALPTLIVAASPSDLFAIDADVGQDGQQICTVQPPPAPPAIAVTLVANDRPAVEERFAFATAGLEGISAVGDRVLRLARSAWWAARQSVGLEQDGDVDRFLRSLERLNQESPLDAGAFTDCVQLIRTASGDSELRSERSKAVTAAVLHAPGPGAIHVLVRSGLAVTAVSESIAAELGIPVQELSNIGVTAGTTRASPVSSIPGALVVAGYCGPATLDAILVSEARHVHFVIDPIEARVAWFTARRMAEYLESKGLAPYALPLRALMSGLETHVPAFSDKIEVPVALGATDSQFNPVEPEVGKGTVVGSAEVTVYFTDGSWLEATRLARFEVLGQAGGHTRIVLSQSLQPGDRVVLLEGNSQELFSDRRIAALDAGPLAPLAQSRRDWLTIVQALYSANKPNLRDVTRALAAAGEKVDYATVRSWVTYSNPSEASTPNRWARFAAFASAFGISLPEPDLHKYFSEIKRWRTLHRKAGRDLARAIRAAYAHRLSAVTLARIEREWGLTARQLLTAARLTTVDSVYVDEGGNSAADKR